MPHAINIPTSRRGQRDAVGKVVKTKLGELLKNPNSNALLLSSLTPVLPLHSYPVSVHALGLLEAFQVALQGVSPLSTQRSIFGWKACESTDDDSAMKARAFPVCC